MNYINYINNLFYGENWFIAWGIVIFLVVCGLAVQLPPIIKAVKEKKKK